MAAAFVLARPWRQAPHLRATYQELFNSFARGLAAARPSPSSSSSAWPGKGDQPERTGRPRAGGHRSRPRGRQAQGAAAWGGEEEDEEVNLFRGLRSNSVLFDEDFKKDAAATRHALRWHRSDVQQSGQVEDSLLHLGPAGTAEATPRWWEDWEAEWDEGWDWEEKWSGQDSNVKGPTQILVGQDDPRRPRGPLLQVGLESSYKPVATLNHSQLAAAVVAARTQGLDELQWQALCRRAELVAMSMTPAELLAIARCVGERQAGQLRLLWKVASLAVERINAFTAEDLVVLSQVYSSLDAVHHGMLNVVALVLADEQDERCLDGALAVEVLAAFARAKYPLPLLMNEARCVLLADNTFSALPPPAALRALESFAQLGSLDGELLAALLPASLGRRGTAAEAFRAARWAASARKILQDLPLRAEAPSRSSHDAEEASLTVISEVPTMSGAEALADVLAALRKALSQHQPQRIRVIASKQGLPRCMLPARDGSQGATVDGLALISGAELLALSSEEGDCSLAAELLQAASSKQTSAEAWQPELQVRWLALGSSVSSSLPPAAMVPLLNAVSTHVPGQLVPHASSLAMVLPCVLKAFGPSCEAATAEAGISLCRALRPELFRLRLGEARQAVRGCLELQALLPEAHASALKPKVTALVKSSLEGMPAKFRAECVFHRRGSEGPGGDEVAAWCSLLADRELLGVAVPEELWQLLAVESQRCLAASGLGQVDEKGTEMSGAAVAVEILEAMLRCSKMYGWEATDPETPLGAVVSTVQEEWKRAHADDGELEDLIHEPMPLPPADRQQLQQLFEDKLQKILHH